MRLLHHCKPTLHSVCLRGLSSEPAISSTLTGDSRNTLIASLSKEPLPVPAWYLGS